MSCIHYCIITDNNYSLLSFILSPMLFLNVGLCFLSSSIILLPGQLLLTHLGGKTQGCRHSLPSHLENWWNSWRYPPHTRGCPVWLWPPIVSHSWSSTHSITNNLSKLPLKNSYQLTVSAPDKQTVAIICLSLQTSEWLVLCLVA